MSTTPSPKKIKFSDLIKTRVPLLELDLSEGIFQLYPPGQMNTQGYTRYVAASRIISKTIRQTDKEARKLIIDTETAIDAHLDAAKTNAVEGRTNLIIGLKELLIRPDFEDLPERDDDEEEKPESAVPELSDKKKFVNLVSRYLKGILLNEILELYEEYSFTVQGLLTSSEYIKYMNEAIEAAFDFPEGLTANWGLAQLQEVQKMITEEINKHAKAEKKAAKAKKPPLTPAQEAKVLADNR